MTTDSTVIIKTVKVAMKIPAAFGKLMILLKAIYSSMSANARYIGSAAKLVIFKDEIKTLDETQTGYKSKPQTKTKAERDAARVKVIKTAWSLAADVQALADEDVENAPAIIEGAGMSVSKHTSRGKQQNDAENGTEEGSVILTAEGKGGHEWRMSKDDETWTLIEYSNTSKTTVKGLTSGQIYFFQNLQVFTKGRKGEWSQSIKIRVK